MSSLRTRHAAPVYLSRPLKSKGSFALSDIGSPKNAGSKVSRYDSTTNHVVQGLEGEHVIAEASSLKVPRMGARHPVFHHVLFFFAVECAYQIVRVDVDNVHATTASMAR